VRSSEVSPGADAQVEDGWFQGRIAELPAVITAAPTLSEVKDNLVDALHEFLASLAEPLEHETSSTEQRAPLDVVISA